MRRILSVLLLIALLAGATVSMQIWKDDLSMFWEGRLLLEKESWIETPVEQIQVEFTGAPLDRLTAVSKKISGLLSAGGNPPKADVQDSPAEAVILKTTVPAALAMPLHDLAEKMVAQEQPPAREARRPASKKIAARRIVRKIPAGPEEKKLRDVRARIENLTKTWEEARARHGRIADLRRQYRHPEELLRNDAEASDLKRKLSDLEMTLAEIIDHYTPAHPRVKGLQEELAGLRSALDRRVLIAEEEERAGWSAREADFRQKKMKLEREERSLKNALAKKTVVIEEAAPSQPAESPEPAPPAAPSAGVRMKWTQTPTVLRELVKKKELEAEKISTGVSAVLIGAALIGFLLGSLGGAAAPGSGSRGGSLAVSDMESPPPPITPRPARSPAARAALPPIGEPPAPPAPEKPVEEADLPGSAWVTLPQLSKVEKGLYTVFAPSGAAADFFARTAQDLLDRLPKSESSQVVAVAAVRSGTGTSTFAANLAVALLSRRPVLLLDLHHTAPSLHTFFSIEASSRDVMASTPWAESVAQTPVDRLVLLPMFSPHTEKEMSDLKLKKRLQAFLKENPIHRIVLIDLAPLGRSELFEEVAEHADLFVLMTGPEATDVSAKPALKRLAKSMKKKPVLRVARSRESLPDAVASRPPSEYEFLIE